MTHPKITSMSPKERVHEEPSLTVLDAFHEEITRVVAAAEREAFAAGFKRGQESMRERAQAKASFVGDAEKIRALSLLPAPATADERSPARPEHSSDNPTAPA